MANYNKSMFGGFYAPDSISGQYVASKRDDQGSYVYDKASQDIGIEKQAALQNLSESYGNVVNNAYASYLANQRTINTSAMGQGYKAAYNELQQQQLLNTIEQANLSAAQTRQELEANAGASQEAVYQQYLNEVANLDRADLALQNYYNYLNELGYFNQEAFKERYPDYTFNDKGAIESDNNLLYRDIYKDIVEATPYTWQKDGQYVTDENGERLKNFLEYTKANAGTKQEDIDWSTWFNYLGGYQDFLNALEKSASQKARPEYQVQQEKKAAEEAERQKELEEELAKTTGYVYDDLKGKNVKFEEGNPAINEYYLYIDGKKYRLFKVDSKMIRPDYANYLDMINKVDKFDEGQIIRYNQRGQLDKKYYKRTKVYPNNTKVEQYFEIRDYNK